MTQRKDFKKRVRARAEKTGESYSSARVQVARQAATATPDPPPSDRFERVTDRAKRALAAAQEAAGAGPLQTEHVLLGIARQPDGPGRLLRAAKGGAEAVTSAVAAAGEEPPAALRRALEAAFRNADRRDDRRVRTQDLLAGLLAVSDSNAAGILEELVLADPRLVKPATVANLLRLDLGVGRWAVSSPTVLVASTGDLDLIAREVMLLDPPDDLIALGREVISTWDRSFRQQDESADELQLRYRALLRSWLREALGAE